MTHEPLSMRMLRLSQRHDIRNVSIAKLEALAKDIAQECLEELWYQKAVSPVSTFMDAATMDAIKAIEARFDLIEEFPEVEAYLANALARRAKVVQS